MTWRIFHLFCLVAPFLGLGFGSLRDCTEVRTGKFYYFEKATRQKVTVVRNDSLQIETRPNGQELQSRIEWKDDCSYRLVLHVSTPNRDDTVTTVVINASVQAIEKDYYICTGLIDSEEIHTAFTDTVYFDRIRR